MVVDMTRIYRRYLNGLVLRRHLHTFNVPLDFTYGKLVPLCQSTASVGGIGHTVVLKPFIPFYSHASGSDVSVGDHRRCDLFHSFEVAIESAKS
jgi:hypothetical protein